MYISAIPIALAALPGFSLALPQASGGVLNGYGTFNVYSSQKSGLNCSPYFQNSGKQNFADNQKIYGAATSDVSIGLGTYQCNYAASDRAKNPSNCTQSSNAPYNLPSDTQDKSDPHYYQTPYCPGAQCGKCYTITNKATQKKVTVQIIDACPAMTAWNYCKAIVKPGQDSKLAVPANQRCGDPDTNQVDIDESAYPVLTNGQAYKSVSYTACL
ncbi:MAG: hypothetical protein LQ350_000937 [Teloschistes chrysophthalmus]|nr:MAG: hypothetical protein LQ350_000937 [Niorma chrysophthalma]